MTTNGKRERPPWRRMTPGEVLRDEAQRRSAARGPLLPALLAVGTSAATVFVGLTFGVGRKDWSPRQFLARRDAAFLFPVLSIALFVVFYLWILTAARRGGRRSDTLICTTCFEFFTRGQTTRCPCGGSLADAVNWTRDRCPRCGYDIRGSASLCPECGRSLHDIHPAPVRTPPRPRLGG